LVAELQGAIGRIRAALDAAGSTSDAACSTGEVTLLKAAIEAAIALILEEHQDWHLLVRPHNLPLA
jgi:microcompartment protein CcmL/EutN